MQAYDNDGGGTRACNYHESTPTISTDSTCKKPLKGHGNVLLGLQLTASSLQASYARSLHTHTVVVVGHGAAVPRSAFLHRSSERCSRTSTGVDQRSCMDRANAPCAGADTIWQPRRSNRASRFRH
ncbi:hypothetical protein WOLCODRAFT_29636 [Wolfiporia cocos MD-104 SS10]|uniref:Uncharacterized protein n=1 Tax=Wolfiporia cocos (strain MD-104) TaxID=742152 RepID=A0A2H3JSF7_WOLCO|nr:hypothetical protein WOLCODRAFT_29636 [Wolfiporia cocos MD-104 SS10]